MKEIIKIALCTVLAAIAVYFVGEGIGPLMVGEKVQSLLNAKFIGVLLAAIFFTWEAVDLAISRFFKKNKNSPAQ